MKLNKGLDLIRDSTKALTYERTRPNERLELMKVLILNDFKSHKQALKGKVLPTDRWVNR